MFSTNLVSGQSFYSFGVKGGLNVSTLGNGTSGYAPKLGYNGGIYSNVQFYQELGVQMEILVSQQGARNEVLSDLKLDYTYLLVPLMANIYFIESASLECGLQAGYLINAKQLDRGDKYDIRNEVRNWDFGGIVGLSYIKPYGMVGLRYNLGIINTNSATPGAEIKFQNKVLQIYIALALYNSE